MPPTDHSRDCWPGPQQELLLKASLLQGEAAVAAWRHWVSTADLDRLDQASFGLLPLLHDNLRRHGVDHPLLDRFKGIHRLTWYKNRLLFHSAAAALSALDRAGVRHLLLKGAALALLHYADSGLRPMSDVDILVPHRQAIETIGALIDSGWVPSGRSPDLLTEQYVSTMTQHNFTNSTQQNLDLHWHVLFSDRYGDNVNDALWREAVPTTLHNVPTLALHPTDLLLNVCEHGVRWNPIPAFRWAADATIIVSHVPCAVDWDRLITEAHTRHLALPLCTALTYVQERLEAPVPSAVLDALRNIPATQQDRVEHELNTYQVNPILFPFRRLRRHYIASAQHIPEAHLPQRLRAFVRYLRMYWGVPRWRQIPILTLNKATRAAQASSRSNRSARQ
jgi:hypothetical protein